MEKLIFFEFFDTAANILLESGQRAQLLLDIDRLDNVDAIVAKNMPKHDFGSLAESNFIPLIAGDCVVNDPIFYEVSLDYKVLKDKADAALPTDYTYVCSCPKDERLRQQLLDVFPDVQFVKSYADLRELNELINQIVNSICQPRLIFGNHHISHVPILGTLSNFVRINLHVHPNMCGFL